MAQQIKKKFIQNDAVDSTKIKLLKDQAVRGQKQDGSEVELLKLDGSDKLVHDGQEIAFKSQLDAEAVAREQGDDQVQSNLDSETLARQQADSTLQDNIELEAEARYNEDYRIEGKFDSLISEESSIRASAVMTLNSRITSEISRAEGEESRIEGLLSDEVSRAEGEESRIESKFDSMMASEEASRIAGDSDLQGKLDVEKGRIDAILLASEADKDSFAEIVQLINSVDTENDSAFASYVLSNNAALAQEVSDRQQGDSDLQDSIDSEESRAMGEESRIESKFDGMMSTETAARIAGDADLQSQVDAEESRAMGEESRIESKFDGMMSTETAARIAADSDLQSQLNSEVARALSSESMLQSNIDTESSARQAADSAEQSRAMGVESSLQSQITQEVSDRQSAVSAEASARQAADSAEASARQAADTTLQSNIDAEETRAMGVEAELQSDLDNLDGYAQDIRSDLDQEILDRQSADSTEQAARIAGDNSLQSSLNSEISARQSADSSLQSQITQEISDRQSAMSTEQSARIAGDASTLQSSKDYTDGKISLVMSNLDTEALDSLVEVVNAFQNADSDLNQTISDLSAAATSALAAEQAARIAADQVLQDNLDAEIMFRQEMDESLQIEINNEQSRAMGIEAGLQSEIDALTTSLSDETSAREAADLLIKEQFAVVTGVNLDQPYTPYEDANYIFEANSFWEADRILDQVIFGESNLRVAADQALEDSKVNKAGDTMSGELYFDIDGDHKISILENKLVVSDFDETTKVEVKKDRVTGTNSAGIFSIQESGLMINWQDQSTMNSSMLATRAEEFKLRLGQSFWNQEEQSSTPILPVQDHDFTVKKYVDDADSALESRIEALEIQTDGPYFEKQKFVIDESSELSSIELSHECMENSLVVCVGRLMVHKDEDYSVSVVDGKSVLTWMGDFASGGVEAIEEGDVIFVTFARSV